MSSIETQDKEIAEFYSWLTNSCSFKQARDAKISIHSFELTGRGVAATTDIHDGDLIIQVPAAAILSTESLSKCPISSIIGSEIVPVANDKFLPLAVMLMYERRNPNSFWRPFIKLLPTEYDIPLMWSTEDFEMLRGSVSFLLVQNVRKSLSKTYFSYIIPATHKYPEELNQSNCSFEDFLWAMGTIWSRGYWQDAAETIPCIVPFADMINHTTESWQTGGVATYEYYESDKMFRVYAKRDYVAGDQVFTTYGRKSNYELISDYGFVMDDNPHLDLFFQMPDRLTNDSSELLARKNALLTRMNYRYGAVHIRADDTLQLEVHCRVYAAAEDEVEAFETDCADIAQLKGGGQLSLDTEIRCAEYLIRVCDFFFSHFPSSLQTDRYLLAADGDSLSYRSRMALCYRIEEKSAVIAIRDAFEQRLAELKQRQSSVVGVAPVSGDSMLDEKHLVVAQEGDATDG